MKIDLSILNKYNDERWLNKTTHKTLPIHIFKYSHNTQIEDYWDGITTICRGLVVDNDGNVIAKPFSKFFNIEENKHKSTSDFKVYEKLDGSLIILFYYNDQWIATTAGSFYSDQSIIANELINTEYKNLLNNLNKKYTYCFELIGKDNRIVVEYDFDNKLVLLAAFETETGNEVDETKLHTTGFELVKTYHYTDYKNLVKLNWNNYEGFVIKFSNGDRCKIKFEEYKRLHFILSCTSSYTVWKYLKDYDNIDKLYEILDDVHYDWVTKVSQDLLFKYNEFYGYITTLCSHDIPFKIERNTLISNETYFNKARKLFSGVNNYNNIETLVELKELHNDLDVDFINYFFDYIKLKKEEKEISRFYQETYPEEAHYIMLFLYNQENKLKESIWKKYKPEFEKMSTLNFNKQKNNEE